VSKVCFAIQGERDGILPSWPFPNYLPNTFLSPQHNIGRFLIQIQFLNICFNIAYIQRVTSICEELNLTNHSAATSNITSIFQTSYK